MPELSADDLEAFHRDGFVKVDEAFPRSAALAMQDEIWRELETEFGIDREDRGTWRVPPASPRGAKFSPLNAQVAAPRFRRVISELLAPGRWDEPSNWGGFLVTFPTPKTEPWDVPVDLWHFDHRLGGERGVSGLLIFTFFSHVGERAGGTLVVRGSPHVVARYGGTLSGPEREAKHSVHRAGVLASDPWLTALAGGRPRIPDRVAHFMEHDATVAGVPVRVVELTGEPGDAVFCHPWLLHAPAGRNLGDEPRIMRSKFLW